MQQNASSGLQYAVRHQLELMFLVIFIYRVSHGRIRNTANSRLHWIKTNVSLPKRFESAQNYQFSSECSNKASKNRVADVCCCYGSCILSALVKESFEPFVVQ